jgi:XTP/dITP diphosphohydrolase
VSDPRFVRPERVVLATRNPGKSRELSAMFADAGIALVDLAAAGLAREDPAEDALEAFETFEENARAKARWFSAQLPGAFVVADDSGLAVDALGGAPGVQSKRWSQSGVRGRASGAALDDANNAHLLASLSGASSRAAGYVCVVVCTDGEREWSARGECRGRILEAPSGRGGFGYDPLFFSDDLQCAFGEATRDEKARVSHRGRAFRALVRAFASEVGDASGAQR